MADDRAGLAGRRAWLGLAVLVIPTLLVAMDLTALFLALPRLSSELGASSVEQLWISDSYGFLVAGFVITMGTLGDRIGRRRLLLIGAAAFAVLSVVAAYSTTPQMLIAVRALLGIAGATLMPSTLALISNMFRDGRQRGKAIAVWATGQFAGGALGPVLAGFLLGHFWWGSVFLVAVPAMGLLLAAAPALLPEYRNPDAGRLDIASAGLSLAAVLPAVYGLKQLTIGGVHGTTVPLVWVAAGLLAGVVFVRRQLRLDAPLLNLRLFASRPFTAILVALVLAGVAMAGLGLLVTQYLQSVLGFSPFAAALLFAPMGLGVAAGTMSTPALARRMRPARAIAGGLALSAAGCVLLILVGGQHSLPLVMAGIAVLAVGTGPLFALGTGLVIGSVPPERAGSAASMSEMSNYIGGALGIAALGVLSAGIYRSQMAHLAAGGVPAAAGQNLASATAASQHLAAPQAAVLLHAAHAATTSGLNVAGAVAAVIFAALTLVITVTDRAGRGAAAAAPADGAARDEEFATVS
jgi:DHA2 family multidrug resistance protein-like MFS transporter